MFLLDHPEILSHLGQLSYGYQPVQFANEHFALIVKAGKDFILTERLKNELKIYLVPDIANPGRSLGFITAFFDDHDEPLVMLTPLFAGDAMLTDLTAVLSQDQFNLYFFDEHDRELLGSSSQVRDVARFREVLAETLFPMFDMNNVAGIHAAMTDWFGLRILDDDAGSFTVDLGERLFFDDFLIMDLRNEAYNFVGGDGQAMMTSLEREEPGPFQERDIVALLRRAFPSETVFLNPIREDSGTELTDVLVVTDEVVLLVQAKDSPNTKAALDRSIDRKQKVIRSHIEKGAKQLRGALAYILERKEILLRTGSGTTQSVAVADRATCGVVVVREMFDDDYRACSAPVLAVAAACDQPCVLLSYPSLHVLTLHLPSPDRLISGLLQIFDVATEHGEYPKPRFLEKPQRDDEVPGV